MLHSADRIRENVQNLQNNSKGTLKRAYSVSWVRCRLFYASVKLCNMQFNKRIITDNGQTFMHATHQAKLQKAVAVQII
jgi:hypothetical protein